jgi:hypothetical protein
MKFTKEDKIMLYCIFLVTLGMVVAFALDTVNQRLFLDRTY